MKTVNSHMLLQGCYMNSGSYDAALLFDIFEQQSLVMVCPFKLDKRRIYNCET